MVNHISKQNNNGKIPSCHVSLTITKNSNII